MRSIPMMVLLATTSLPVAAQTASTIVATDGPRFELHSAFWVNLHHFLYVLARAEKGHDADRPAVTSALADTTGLAALTAEQRREWRAALDHYVATMADRDILFDGDMVALKTRLAAAGSQPALPRAGVDSALARVLDAAAPAYRAGWWPRHDADNRAWVAAMLPLLARHGASIATGVTSAFRAQWPDRPIRVDVSAYTNWAGAYTTNGPAHIMISSMGAAQGGSLGLELLFHESLHTMDRQLARALREEGQTQGKRNAAAAVHAIIFYTAGEVTRRSVEAGHIPYAERYGLWTRGRSIAPYHAAVRAHWQPYLDGRTTFEQAIAALVASL